MDLYGMQAKAIPLPSERDQNFLLETVAGERYVLKIANAGEERSLLEAQQQVLLRLNRHNVPCPRVVPLANGATIETVSTPQGRTHLVWMITYLPGVPMGRVQRHSRELLRDLGRCIGELDQALAGFDHPAMHRDLLWDMAQGMEVLAELAPLIIDGEIRDLVERLTADFARHTAPLLPALRRSVVYNDANDFNVLVGGGDDVYSRNQRVVGLIDFGDMVHSFIAADPAVAAAYALLGKSDPLIAASAVVEGYHRQYPLTEEEIAALFGLICLRLCMSVAIAAYQRQQRPDNEYLVISQGIICRTLPKLVCIHPRLATAFFRRACGLPPVKDEGRITRWLRANAASFSPVLEADLGRAAVLDLGVDGSLISADGEENRESILSRRIHDILAQAGAETALGRYDEPRLPDATTSSGDGWPLAECETIHLGIDIFANAGTAVCAPLAGRVRAIADGSNADHDGTSIILEHCTVDGIPFYTLYRYLKTDIHSGLALGMPVNKGDMLGRIGTAQENGNQPPHLHCQLIIDLLEMDCAFPAAARPFERSIWKALSPDPNFILALPVGCFPPGPPTREETLKTRRRRIGSSVRLSFREPVKIVRGWMQYLFDDEGRRYLDAYNNVPHVGHCHPRVVEAGRRQMGVLNTNTRYLHDLINQYAERLSNLLPEPLRVCFFVNSASEANELALRMVRAYTGQRHMIVLEAAYHGHTTSLIAISPYKHSGPGGSGAPSWVHTAPLPDDFRGPYRRDDPLAGEKYAAHVEKIIEDIRRSGDGVAGFIAESCPSVGGQIFFPPGYLQAVYRSVRATGGICIADEVQTGFGRLGTHFWAFQPQGVVPDIVVLGKPMGNGHPIGALITTPEIAAAFDNGMEFFSTFGGNPVSCAIGLAVLDVILEENLPAHALRVGERLLKGLQSLLDRYSLLGDVRGSGLFLGVELVRSRDTLEPATEEASFIINRLRDRGILCGIDGPLHNVIKIRPPMPFNEENAGWYLEALEGILVEDFQEYAAGDG